MAVRNAIEIRGLTKRYGSLTAIENITFEVRRGELFGLIGPRQDYAFPPACDVAESRWSGDGRWIRYYPGNIKKSAGGWDVLPRRFSLSILSVEENLEFSQPLMNERHVKYDLIAPIYLKWEPFRKRRASSMSEVGFVLCFVIHRRQCYFSMNLRPGSCRFPGEFGICCRS